MSKIAELIDRLKNELQKNNGDLSGGAPNTVSTPMDMAAKADSGNTKPKHPTADSWGTTVAKPVVIKKPSNNGGSTPPTTSTSIRPPEMVKFDKNGQWSMSKADDSTCVIWHPKKLEQGATVMHEGKKHTVVRQDPKPDMKGPSQSESFQTTLKRV